MATLCPRCGGVLSDLIIEGVRKPILSLSETFECPHCQAQLIIDYSNVKTFVFNVFFVIGAVALIIGFPGFSLGAVALVGVLVVYVAVGWLVLLRIRKVIYADNRLNEAIKQKKQA